MRTPAWLQKYERPAPVVIGNPIAKRLPSRYTGAGGDGVIQRKRPVETDLFQDHEGEYVVSAEDTKKIGGPKGVEEKLGITSSGRPAPAPIGFRRGGRVRRYWEGGPVETPNPTNLDAETRAKNAADAARATGAIVTESGVLPGGGGFIAGTGKSPYQLSREKDAGGGTISGEAVAGAEQQDRVNNYSGKVDDYLGMIDDIANGTSPVFQRMANMAFNDLNPSLQVGLTLAAMNIAQSPYMTEGMKQTVMMQAIRNAGVQQSNLAADLATKAMSIAHEAIGEGLTWSANQRDFNEAAARNEKNDAWKDFEYTAQYGSDQDVIDAYKAATGRDLDPAAVAEIRGYARSKRGNDLVVEGLTIQSIQDQIGTQTYNNVKSWIDGGATLEMVLAEFPEFGQDANGNPLDMETIQQRYDGIYEGGPLGDRDWNRMSTMVDTLIRTGGEENYATAAAMLEEYFPESDIDFSNLVNKENAGKFMDGMDILSTNIAAGLEWAPTLKALKDAGLLDALGGESVAEQLYKDTKLNSTPTMRLLRSYPDEVIAIAWPGVDPIKVRGAIAEATMLGGFVYNSDGDLVPADPDIISEVMQRHGIVLGEGGPVDMAGFNAAVQSAPFQDALTYMKVGETNQWNVKGSVVTFKKTGKGTAELVTGGGGTGGVKTPLDSVESLIAAWGTVDQKNLPADSEFWTELAGRVKTPDYSMKSTGMGGDNLFATPPAVGDFVKWGAKPAKVTNVALYDKWGTRDYQYITVQDSYGNYFYLIAREGEEWEPGSTPSGDDFS